MSRERPGGEGPEARGEPEGGPVFRYDRARRLERASENVRWLVSRYGKKGDGPLKSLFSSRANRILFLMVAVLAAAYFLGSFLSSPRESGRIGDERFAASAFWYEGRVLVAVRREAAGPAANRAAPRPATPEGDSADDARVLRILVALPGGGGASSAFPLGSGPSEDFRMSLPPADGARPPYVRVSLALGDSALILQAKVE